MPLELTPLDVATLSPAVQRVVQPATPAPAKMMAARGLAPMGPRDLVTVLYQLAFEPDPQVSQAAQQTAAKLPDNILGAALGDDLDARVVEYFALRVVEKTPLLEKVLFNPHTHDETFVTLAGHLQERELEIMAQNAQRLLRYPSIIEAIYFNKNARMSTVERLLELAVRNGITLDRIPQFKDIAANILNSGSKQSKAPEVTAMEDAMFSALMSEAYEDGPVGDMELAEEQQEEKDDDSWSDMSVNRKIRLATLGSVFQRMRAIRDSNRMVAMAAIKSPGITDQEIQRYAGHRGLSEDVIRYIAERREWQKDYVVKVSLVNNPKCPLAHAMRLISHLRANDLRALARSKNVSAQVVQAARRAIDKRS